MNYLNLWNINPNIKVLYLLKAVVWKNPVRDTLFNYISEKKIKISKGSRIFWVAVQSYDKSLHGFFCTERWEGKWQNKINLHKFLLNIWFRFSHSTLWSNFHGRDSLISFIRWLVCLRLRCRYFETMPNRIVFIPSEAVSFKSLTHKQVAQLIIRNTWDRAIIFKMKTNRPKLFKMRPVYGMVQEGHEVSLLKFNKQSY